MRKLIVMMLTLCLLVSVSGGSLAAGVTLRVFTPFADVDFAAQGYNDLITAWEGETGNIVEDERVWGATEWGLGYVSDVDAPPCGQDAVSHTDGICLCSSVWLDDVCIMKDGVIVDAELKRLDPTQG